MRVLGIDPSFNNTGFAMAELNVEKFRKKGEFKIADIRLVETEPTSSKTVRKNSDDLRRAREIHKAVAQAVDMADVVVAEIPQGTQSSRAAWALGICLGILSSIDRPLIQVSPQEVKMFVAGRKTVSKAEMIEWATLKYPKLNWRQRKVKGEMTFLNKNEHMADACAIVECGLASQQFLDYLSFLKALEDGDLKAKKFIL